MSKYSKYAKELDTMARRNFAAYLEAKAEFESAEQYYKENRRPNGLWVADSEKIERAARAEADYHRAKIALEKVKKEYEDSLREAERIRRDFEKDVHESSKANPEDMDSNTIELLKSGILKASEYTDLMSKYRNNCTMIRIIGSYAGKKIEEEKDLDRNERLMLQAVHSDSIKADGREYVEMFNVLHDAYTRSVKNPHMIPYWDELTSKIVENF